jgi:hypothetical protein
MRKLLRVVTRTLFIMSLAATAFSLPAPADTLDQIRARGSLRWGGDACRLLGAR